MAKKTKIYFWLKLDNNFFKNLAVRALRKRAGGDTYLIIYQRLLLEALETSGVIEYQGLLEDLPAELAISLDEKEEDVRTTIEYFRQANLIQIGDDGSAFFEQVPMLIDQETNWNRYKRNAQKNKKLEKFQPTSNHLPTDIDIDIEKEIEVEGDIEKALATPPAPPKKSMDFGRFVKTSGLKVGQDQIQRLLEYIGVDNMPLDLVKLAITKTVDQGIEAPAYTFSILDNWKAKGITTVEQALKEQEEFESRKTSKNKNKTGNSNPYMSDDEVRSMREKYGF